MGLLAGGEVGGRAATWKGYLRIDGVAGESREKSHKDWIEISMFTRGTFADDWFGEGGVLVKPLEVVKTLDRASPSLSQLCATGRIIRKVRMDLVRTRNLGSTVTLLYVDLENVRVSRVAMESSSDQSPKESVAFLAASATMVYVEVDQRELPRGVGELQWDQGTGWTQFRQTDYPDASHLPVRITRVASAIPEEAGRLQVAWPSDLVNVTIETVTKLGDPWIEQHPEFRLEEEEKIVELPIDPEKPRQFWRLREMP